MNRTNTLVGLVAGLVGAGISYTLKSRDTTRDEGVTGYEAKPNLLAPSARISAEFLSKYKSAILVSRELVRRFKQEVGSPGLVVGVSVDGEIIWEEGIGLSNLETASPCHASTAMRIASISKPMTAALLAKLCEGKKVELDKSVYEYVSYFPRKVVGGEEVDITVRQLASHTAGVRHYKKRENQEGECRDFGGEFYFKEKVENVEKSVEMFKDDDLCFKPGTSFEYSTHGYTLLSAVIETAGGEPFARQIQKFFKVFGLENTHLDKVPKIIYQRASYYDKDKQGRTVNAELADLSYKWAGGGLISTVGDLLKFGNAMLYCYQQTPNDKPGYLKRETVQEMWTPVENTVMKWGLNAGYGLGWTVVPKVQEIGGVAESQKFHVGHSGGAVGASSVLIVLPREIQVGSDDNNNEIKAKLPQGVTVAILVNLENVSCRALGQAIAEEFYKVSSPQAPSLYT